MQNITIVRITTIGYKYIDSFMDLYRLKSNLKVQQWLFSNYIVQ